MLAFRCSGAGDRGCRSVQLTSLQTAHVAFAKELRPRRCKRRRRLSACAQLQATADAARPPSRSQHKWDLVALGNLCVDIVHSVDEASRGACSILHQFQPRNPV